MYRESVFLAIILVILAAVLGGGYQFYFKERLQQYAEDEKVYQDLEKKLSELESKFSNTRPDRVLEVWSAAVQPWVEAVNDRKKIFNLGTATEIVPVPEGKIPRFHYEEQYNQMFATLLQETYQKGVYFPQTSFGAPAPSTLTGRAPTAEEVHAWLQLIAFGSDTVRLLMNNGAVQIFAIEVWPPWQQGTLEMRSVGLSFSMTLRNLVDFIDNLTGDPRQYYNINAIRIANRSLRLSADPLLEVAMVLTRAKFDETAAPATVAVAGGGAPGASPFGGGSPFGGFGLGASGQSGTGSTATDKKQSWWKKILPF